MMLDNKMVALKFHQQLQTMLQHVLTDRKRLDVALASS